MKPASKYVSVTLDTEEERFLCTLYTNLRLKVRDLCQFFGAFTKTSMLVTRQNSVINALN